MEATMLSNGASNRKRNAKEMESWVIHRLVGIILGFYWGYIGIMENEMETTIVQ